MIETDVQKLSPGDIIDLFELDASSIGGSVFRWANDVNELDNDIVWNGDTYSRFPIEADGFEKSANGKSPRPTLRVANVTGVIGAVVRDLDDLIGATVTRRRTFVKYLDAVNFAAGNPQADPNVAFPDEIWAVDRKSAENGLFIELELAAAFDLTGVYLPRRQVVQCACVSGYRSAECGYAGGAVADKNDNPTSDSSVDQCGLRVTSCQLRFGVNAELPFGGFPGVGRL
jgi:lambda family phage minor tail protein L